MHANVIILTPISITSFLFKDLNFILNSGLYLYLLAISSVTLTHHSITASPQEAAALLFLVSFGGERHLSHPLTVLLSLCQQPPPAPQAAASTPLSQSSVKLKGDANCLGRPSLLGGRQAEGWHTSPHTLKA